VICRDQNGSRDRYSCPAWPEIRDLADHAANSIISRRPTLYTVYNPVPSEGLPLSSRLGRNLDNKHTSFITGSCLGTAWARARLSGPWPGPDPLCVLKAVAAAAVKTQDQAPLCVLEAAAAAAAAVAAQGQADSKFRKRWRQRECIFRASPTSVF